MAELRLAEPRNILALRLRSIGDTVLLTPALFALKRQWPDARLALVVEQPIDELVRGLAAVDEVWALAPHGAGAWPKRLRLGAGLRGRYDLAIDFHGGTTAALLTWASRAPARIGLAAYRHGWAYTHRLPSPHKGSARALTLHTRDSNLAVVAALGVSIEPAPAPRIALPPGARDAARQALSRAGLDADRSFVVVHPGAALASKRWPLEGFAEVAKALAADGVAVVAGFAAREIEIEARFRSLTALPSVRGLGLGSYAALVGLSALFVGNDSGPAHLAAAQDVRVVAVYGSQDPRVWRPVGEGHEAIWAALACSPCRGTSCANPVVHECLQTIAPDRVLAAARRALVTAGA